MLFFTVTIPIANADYARKIKKGEAAPEDGVFYTNESHAYLVARVKNDELRCKERIEYTVKIETVKLTTELNQWKIEAEYWKRQFQLAEDYGVKQRDLLLKEVVESKRVSWYRKPWFISTVTIIATVGVAAFSVWTFKELVENR